MKPQDRPHYEKASNLLNSQDIPYSNPYENRESLTLVTLEGAEMVKQWHRAYRPNDFMVKHNFMLGVPGRMTVTYTSKDFNFIKKLVEENEEVRKTLSIGSVSTTVDIKDPEIIKQWFRIYHPNDPMVKSDFAWGVPRSIHVIYYH